MILDNALHAGRTLTPVGNTYAHGVWTNSRERCGMSNFFPRCDFVLQSLFRRQRRCPHCGCNDCSVAARKHLVTRVRECAGCKLYFTDPIYQPLFSSSLYEALYNGEGLTTRLPSDRELRTLLSTNFAHSDKCFRARIDAIRSLGPSGRLLEIGASWGYFVHQWNTSGGDGTGIEISDHRRCFGINKLNVELVRDFESLNGTVFDVIYTAHTLEHFTDLSTVFPAIYAHLRSNAALVIEVPNFAFRERGGEVLSGIGAVHPLGFSRSFFEGVLPRYGFGNVTFFDSWDSFPHRPSPAVTDCVPDNIICLAYKCPE